jgi:hypothetical protein
MALLSLFYLIPVFGILILSAGLLIARSYKKHDTTKSHWKIKTLIILFIPTVLFHDFAINYLIFKYNCSNLESRAQTVLKNVDSFIYNNKKHDRNCLYFCSRALTHHRPAKQGYSFIDTPIYDASDSFQIRSSINGQYKFYRYSVEPNNNSVETNNPTICMSPPGQYRVPKLRPDECFTRKVVWSERNKPIVTISEINGYNTTERTYVHSSGYTIIKNKKVLFDNRNYRFHGNWFYAIFFLGDFSTKPISTCRSNDKYMSLPVEKALIPPGLSS